jgi:hypothetical protein
MIAKPLCQHAKMLLHPEISPRCLCHEYDSSAVERLRNISHDLPHPAPPRRHSEVQPFRAKALPRHAGQLNSPWLLFFRRQLWTSNHHETGGEAPGY